MTTTDPLARMKGPAMTKKKPLIGTHKASELGVHEDAIHTTPRNAGQIVVVGACVLTHGGKEWLATVRFDRSDRMVDVLSARLAPPAGRARSAALEDAAASV